MGRLTFDIGRAPEIGLLDLPVNERYHLFTMTGHNAKMRFPQRLSAGRVSLFDFLDRSAA